MIRLGNRSRGGFTLVEMLVVITIISILAALITAAAASALWAAKQTKIKVEVDMLAAAMESFKQKYNSYPPANLTCPNDGNGNLIANAQLTAFVARAFPRYAPVNAASLRAQIGYDLSNTGVDVSEFNPQVALVFWLSGFGPDPTDPFNRNNLVVSRSSFFSFNQTQLMAWTPAASATGSLVTAAPSSTGTLWVPNPNGGTMLASTVPSYGIGQMVYNAPYGNAAYCYFDHQSYGILYNPLTSVVGGAAYNDATNGAGVVSANSGASGSLPVENLNGLLLTFGLYNGTGNAMPYIFDVNNSSTLNQGDTFCKPTSYQIISAGQDGCFGTTIPPTTGSYGRLYPTAFNYDLPPPSGGSGDDDNVTNFCEKNSLESAKP
ncbi:MAG TPA: prepilin-type N-terminal cleavage/methylation domain-containing protein [Pirellulales bacterium]|jgi:prepilin-type N-terminal cleavage/methylation domain-containing protein|nr:prepilin-type N-terminal cleavage/methylation domain-containing protein [Pirellulales bacterium]